MGSDNDQASQGNVEGRSHSAIPAVRPLFASKRAEVASRTKRTHLPWVDEHGVTQAFFAHNDAHLFRDLWRQLPAEAFCTEWRESTDCAVQVGCFCVFAHRTWSEIGFSPSPYYSLQTITQTVPMARTMLYAPDTVLWWPRPWLTSDRPRAAKAFAEMLNRGDYRAVLEQQRWEHLRKLPTAELLRLRADEAALQRGEPYWCDCLPPAHICRLHLLIERAFGREEPRI
jgi:hypothetical protein